VTVRVAAWLAGALATGAAAAHAVGFAASGRTAALAVYVAWTLAALAPLVVSALAARRVLDRTVRRAWAIGVVAGLAWLASALYRFVDGSVPSAADVFLVLFALVSIGGVAVRAPSRAVFWLFTLDALPLVGAAVVVVALAQGDLAGISPLSQATAVVIGTLYVFLALVSLQLLALQTNRRRITPEAALYAVGIALLAAAALFWPAPAAARDAAAGHWSDPLWSTGLVVLAIFGVLRCARPDRHIGARQPTGQSGVRAVAPALAVVVLVVARATAGGSYDVLLETAVAVSIGALIARFALVRHERRGLLAALSAERRKLESEQALLAEAELRYRTLVEQLPLVSYINGADGSVPVIFISPQIEAITGYRVEEMLADPGFFPRILHPEDSVRVLAEHAHAFATGEPLETEYRIITRDGRAVWFQDEGRITTDKSGARILHGFLLDVTDKIEAEKELQRVGDRLSTIIDNIPGAVYRCRLDADWTMELVTPAIEEITGYPASDFVENVRSYASVIHPDDRARVDSGIREALDGDRPFVLEYRIVDRNGAVRWVHERGQGVVNPAGAVEWLDGAILDVTDRREIEEALRETEERFRTMADSAPTLIWMTDTDGRPSFHNKGWLDFTGRSTSEEIAAPYSIVHPDDREGAREAWERAYAAGRGYEIEYRMRRADGAYRWILDRVVPRTLPNGEFAGHTGVAVDITDRRRMERELREARDTLSALIEASPVPTVAFDRDGHVTLWNPAAEATFGWTAEEAVGRFNPLAPGEERASFVEILEANREGKISRNVEVRRRRKDGSPIEVAASSAPLRDAGGEVVGMVSLLADVTAQKQAEQELRASEERFRAYFEHASIGMALTATDGTFIRVNAALADMLGYAVEELLGRTFLSVTHPEDIAQNLELIDALLAGEQPSVELEKRYVRRDGTAVWALMTSSLIRNARGEPELLVTQIQDISARKDAEQRHLEAESRYRTLVEQLPLAVYIDALNAESSAIYMSPQVESMLGYPVTEWLADGGMFPRLLHPDDRARVLDEVGRDASRDERFDAEYRLIAQDGRTVWIRDEAVTIRDEDGDPLYAQGYMLDITERKETEERLRAAEERYRRLVEELPAVVYTAEAGTEGRWLYVSPQIEAILGVSAAEWVEHEGPFAAHVHPDDIDRIVREEDEQLRRGDAYFAEYRMLARGGRTVWVQDQATVVRGDDGAALYMRGFLLDITERKQAQEALRRTEAELERLLEAERGARADAEGAHAELAAQNERLRELDRLKDEFVALVSHELRTPLTSIHGYLELVLEGEAGDLTDDQARFLGVVDRNAQRLQRLVGDLLFVAQVDAGRLSLQHTRVNLSALAVECVEAATPTAGDKGIRLELSADEIPPVWADRARIGQLLDNLVSNALKFTPDGGRVEVKVSRRNGSALVEVVDTGMGIPEEEQEHLFERFFRTSGATSRAIQGTGLGLAITKAIAEGHGGSVMVESSEGAGTTFRVELPFTPVPENGDPRSGVAS
jgi:PAS domain S-box-containing protein